jgi:hypothetical protein
MDIIMWISLSSGESKLEELKYSLREEENDSK